MTHPFILLRIPRLLSHKERSEPVSTIYAGRPANAEPQNIMSQKCVPRWESDHVVALAQCRCADNCVEQKNFLFSFFFFFFFCASFTRSTASADGNHWSTSCSGESCFPGFFGSYRHCCCSWLYSRHWLWLLSGCHYHLLKVHAGSSIHFPLSVLLCFLIFLFLRICVSTFLCLFVYSFISAVWSVIT